MRSSVVDRERCRAGALLQTSTGPSALEFALVPTDGRSVFMRYGDMQFACLMVCFLFFLFQIQHELDIINVCS